jgi:2-polyprenyl-3-methyl-5-hydroxy-6-metoxy-1,4-benzoquinol methylase
VSHQENLVPLNECLACGSPHLIATLDLGKQPLANSFKNSPSEIQEEYPLAINRCSDCFHLQLTHAVDPELMFKEYLYVSGTSLTMREYFKWFAAYALETYELFFQKQAMSVLDIGCNDGSQLECFDERVAFLRGVDPATNLCEIASKKGLRISNAFFNEEWTKNRGNSDILVAQNVFAHNSDPLGFLRAAKNVMGKSLLFVQTSQADMILNGEFDTIYHEHISFFNVLSMNKLCKRAGLFLIDVIKTPLHGNSYLFVITDDARKMRRQHINNLIDMERKAGLYTDATYSNYAEKVFKIKQEVKTIETCRHPDAGFTLVGYGAAAKGMTFLNFTKLWLDFIVDDNPLKQWKFTPGSNIPIIPFDKIKDIDGPIMFVPLAWNFFDEIRSKIKRNRNNKYDRFYRYFPETKIEE